MDTASTDGTFDISNADRLGFSEVQLVQKVVDGVDLLIQVSVYYHMLYINASEVIYCYILCRWRKGLKQASPLTTSSHED